MKPRDGLGLSVMGFAALFAAGCRSPRKHAPPLPVLPRFVAEAIVNENASRIGVTLRAVGNVDGAVTDADGVRRSFSLDGVLFYLEPSYLRFDLKKLGDRQVLLGSNAEHFWIYDKQAGEFRCGLHGVDKELPADFPIQPLQLLDALGLRPIVGETHDGDMGRVQRIDADAQQILFLERDDTGQVVVKKEYWLDRYAPRLIRRVVFRDGDGVVEMESNLYDYRPLDANGPLLPSRIEASWPRAGAELMFTIAKWSLHSSVTPTGPQFATPGDCQSNGS